MARWRGARSLVTKARWISERVDPLSRAGLAISALFFAVSLTPSLLPRTYVMQGVLSGVSLAAGYGAGVFGRWLWEYLEIPLPGARTARRLGLVSDLLCWALAFAFLWQASEWQNSVRLLMQLEPVDTAHPFRVGAIALLIFGALLALARLFQLTFRFFSKRLGRFLATHVANVLGVLLAAGLFYSVINGVLFKAALRATDASFQQLDALIEEGVERPSSPLKTGSEGSLIRWENLGRRGRDFVSSGPTREELSEFFGEEALEPIRVYAGLNSAGTVEARAKLALAELKRVNAFDRSVLVIVTPTGTGWIDPSAMDTLEYLHRGDVASVAVQYSYLFSWLSLMVEPGYGAETARALFSEVYGHWTSLPKDSRPRLYVHGLSLGALNSEMSADIYDIIADPFHGALWSGPTFANRMWRTITDDRKADSPEWLPRFRDGSIVRFANQENGLDIPGAGWGPIRIVYLQYASDPVTFFAPHTLYREPEWMAGPRGPDVSPKLRWFPIVTFLQLAIDMAAAAEAPMGYGHVYAPKHYLDAWLAVTDPPGWTEKEIERLKVID